MRRRLAGALGPCAAHHDLYGPCDVPGSHTVHHGADVDGWWLDPQAAA